VIPVAPQKSAAYLWALIGALVLLAALAIAFLIIVARRRRARQEATRHVA
jgi:hypothetical protein